MKVASLRGAAVMGRKEYMREYMRREREGLARRRWEKVLRQAFPGWSNEGIIAAAEDLAAEWMPPKRRFK